MSDIGIDIVEFSEIKKKLSDKFVKRILCNKELERYDNMKSEEQKIRFLSGRFAAKEAYTKAYTHFDGTMNFTDVCILNNEVGAPILISKYRSQDEVKISISHSTNYAIAVCMLNRKR